MKYKDLTNGKIKTYGEIMKEHTELIFNSSYGEDDLKDIKNIEKYIEMFFEEYDDEDKKPKYESSIKFSVFDINDFIELLYFYTKWYETNAETEEKRTEKERNLMKFSMKMLKKIKKNNKERFKV